MAVSVRTRFEVFKRDEFTCAYCGRRSPEVVLEVDHIVPICDGGQDDAINLTTSCWDCNHGKAGVPLGQVMTGEDPHDKAVLLLEKERQLQEYNHVLAAERARRDEETWEIWRYWRIEQGYGDDKEGLEHMPRLDYWWLGSTLAWCPKEKILEFMDYAMSRHMTKNLKYVAACCRNWRYEKQANKDMQDGYEG